MKDKSENIVKKVCKELGITQKELAEILGLSQNTVTNWAKGRIDIPKWALKAFELLKIEKKFNTIKKIISEEISKQ